MPLYSEKDSAERNHETVFSICNAEMLSGDNSLRQIKLILEEKQDDIVTALNEQINNEYIKGNKLMREVNIDANISIYNKAPENEKKQKILTITNLGEIEEYGANEVNDLMNIKIKKG